MMMRLADSGVLPYQFGDMADTIRTYVAEVKKLATDERAEVKEKNSEIEEGVYQALVDPKKKMVPPTKDPLPPFLNFAPLENASDELTRAAESYDKAFAAADGQAPAGLNEKLIKSERDQLGEGLPNRPWFRNLVYAPGYYTGYGVKTLPGVREAIEQKRWTEADEQIARVSKALQSEADLLDEAAKELKASR
jgi:N-acetylated-alpha-linked acidic dipeptidase